MPNENDVIIPGAVVRCTVGFVYCLCANEGYCLFLKKRKKSCNFFTNHYFVLYTTCIAYH